MRKLLLTVPLAVAAAWAWRTRVMDPPVEAPPPSTAEQGATPPLPIPRFVADEPAEEEATPRTARGADPTRPAPEPRRSTREVTQSYRDTLCACRSAACANAAGKKYVSFMAAAAFRPEEAELENAAREEGLACANRLYGAQVVARATGAPQ